MKKKAKRTQTSKKNTTKKKTTQKTAKKRKIVKVVAMDDVYRLLNRVQMSKKKVVFSVSPEDDIIAQHVIEDLSLTYDRKGLKTKTSYTVYPNEDEELGDEQEIDTEFLKDELPEDGYIF